MVRAWAKPSSSLGPTRRRSICIEDGTDRQDKSPWYVVSVGLSGPAAPHRPFTPTSQKGTPGLVGYYWFGRVDAVILVSVMLSLFR